MSYKHRQKSGGKQAGPPILAPQKMLLLNVKQDGLVVVIGRVRLCVQLLDLKGSGGLGSTGLPGSPTMWRRGTRGRRLQQVGLRGILMNRQYMGYGVMDTLFPGYCLH